MAICEYCNKEMQLYESCIKIPFKINGKDVDPLPVTQERCHDCAVTKGGYHHPGCDVERCPSCGRQAISCDCADEDEEE